MTKIHRSRRFEKSCLRWTSDGADRTGSIRRTKLPSDLDRSKLLRLFPPSLRCFPQTFDIHALRLLAAQGSPSGIPMPML
jgi:hypothetical protein